MAATEVSDNSAVRPFGVGFPESDLAELRRRINATRWPERETVDDDSQGVPLETMKELARYWGTDYDWSRCGKHPPKGRLARSTRPPARTGGGCPARLGRRSVPRSRPAAPRLWQRDELIASGRNERLHHRLRLGRERLRLLGRTRGCAGRAPARAATGWPDHCRKRRWWQGRREDIRHRWHAVGGSVPPHG
jgi:Epoxide hydrolase N terminus